MKTRGKTIASAFIVLTLLAAGCGDDDDGSTSAEGNEPTQNACPVDGCVITITGAEKAGDEILLTWSTNFAADVSNNHIHVYWDTFTAAEVSNDAASRGATQGVWVPTDDAPTFETQDVVSTTARDGSTTLCVTAADRDHNVLSEDAVDCRDVSDLL